MMSFSATFLQNDTMSLSNILVASMAAEPFWSTYLQTSIGGAPIQDQVLVTLTWSCMYKPACKVLDLQDMNFNSLDF